MKKPIAIHQRRYIGSKTKLLPFIENILYEENAGYNSIADVFAGTGVVGSYFNQKAAITLNDTLKSNYFAHQAFLGPTLINQKMLNNQLEYYNNLRQEDLSENYFSNYFSNTYFSHENCQRIGFIRQDIDKFTKNTALNEREKAYLVTSLLYAMDRIANTVGHYDAYRKSGDLDRKLQLLPLSVSKNNHNNQIFQDDANHIIGSLESDVVYIDPPYNSRQYSDAYHVLENVSSWQEPPVKGVAKKMDRTHLKSKYSLKSAALAFSDLIESISSSTKYILVSYNDMGSSGDKRSQARITDHEIISALERRGSLKIYEKEFKQFTTGKSSNNDLKERIFFCRVTPKRKNQSPVITNTSNTTEKYIKSPLNYTGGKYKLLPQLIKYFPSNINTFYDVFCGGANVGVNAHANQIVCIDNNPPLIHLLKHIQKTNFESLNQKILQIVNDYNLSQSYVHGYRWYKSESSRGLGRYNKAGYMNLRDAYNKAQRKEQKNLLLLCLVLYGFNNQLRFNSKGEFNLPVGKRDYNGASRRNLAQFNEALGYKNLDFWLGDFHRLLDLQLSHNDFIYLDPPYLLGTASYNENGGWSKSKEEKLYQVLSKLNSRNVRFALSNVLWHKDKKNEILSLWASKERLNVINLDYHYRNSNYQSTAKTAKTQEVLITNYS